MNDENDIILRMQSSDIAIKIAALQDAAHLSNILIGEAAKALLKTGDSRGLIAEQITLFEGVVPLLEKLLDEQDVDTEARAHIATLLLHFGSRKGVSQLLAMLHSRVGPLLHIVIWMGKAHVVESRDLIVDVLTQWNFRQDVYGGLAVLESLRKLGGDLPPHIYTKVQCEVSEPMRTAIINNIIARWPEA